MKYPTLSTCTKDDIVEALHHKDSHSKTCRCCGTRFVPRRKWQEFCTVRCRNMMHNADKPKQIEDLQMKVAALARQNAELEKELEGLRAEIREKERAGNC